MKSTVNRWLSITNLMILLGISMSLLTAALLWLTNQLFDSNLIYVAVFIIVSLVTVVFARLLSEKEVQKQEKLEYAIKNAASGDYTTRIVFQPNDAHTDLFEQFNSLIEQIEQKLSILQALGEERVLQEADTVEAAVHEERKRLARDLHDSVSQQLFAIHMSSASLPKLYEVNPESAKQVMEQLITMSTSAQTQMRKLIAHLRPMELVNQSLSVALQKWFPDYCRQNHIQGHLDNRIATNLSEAKEHQIFMIIQEAMANVVKHAKCKSCHLSMYETDSQVHIHLQDDGNGFEQDALIRKSYGLITMQERAKKLGGLTEIISKPGTGTIVKVSIPKLGSRRSIDEHSNEDKNYAG